MNVWLQLSDLSSEDLADSRMGSALSTLTSFDWAAEIEFESEAEAEGKEYCPAGMGFIHEDGPILHVMPRQGGLHDVCYMFTETKKVLLFQFPRERSEYAYGLSAETIKTLVEAHYAGRHDEVRERVLAR